ncbi:lipid-A-disaccharide synthase-related protein [Cylindrospermopsis raciborskii]|uniref:lipid-A-disaccharide synthase-related protein n=1 Tax=Cylindrospermopsis raciborskii TaxID=77022 RepID=UPI000C1BE2F3|nr:lipid-A-disaccharide synthase-related protein [Cylindrospermopsis raciborskii]MCZ2201624.1 lipid-A-disaccharide synthase-related protein [Cylindrospermopsis raciborskii PAMP2012]MCZ2207025.1 lipid-A-disaccharide synthase-related protein [Cylindrospermopsis raciborskii PAMP2011]
MKHSSLSSSHNLEKTPNWQLLILSNGHGEDIIAGRIIEELRKLPSAPDIFALPIVGEGHTYQSLNIPRIGEVKTMPSGGFIYMDRSQLVQDIQSGLIKLTWNQIQAVRTWVKCQRKLGNHQGIVAVGDIIPLLFAAISGANYAFVGTAKSEYYVRDKTSILRRNSHKSWWENFSGSIYHPWERWLMSRRPCRAVFPRDTLTTEILRRWPIPAFDAGNPMMDGLEPSSNTPQFLDSNLNYPLIVTLLPGSRTGEAYNNWEMIMVAISSLMEGLHQRKIIFLGAIAPGLDQGILSESLKIQGWENHHSSPIAIKDPHALVFKQKNAYLILTQTSYNECLHWAHLAIAMAGTATEQFVGLGKPVIAFPGKGPQYNPNFAEAQSRLLGVSLILLDHPREVPKTVVNLFQNPDFFQEIATNGWERMGKPGAAKRIAECLELRLGSPNQSRT